MVGSETYLHTVFFHIGKVSCVEIDLLYLILEGRRPERMSKQCKKNFTEHEMEVKWYSTEGLLT